MANILLVEDEPELAKIMSNWLSRSEHFVKVIDRGDDAVSEIKAAKDLYELLILDITLPGRDGFEICEYYRTSRGRAPVMVVSARGSMEDKEQAFTLGADDYITKPFDLKELSMRVAALLRRSSIAVDEIEINDIRVNIAERTATKCGVQVRLTPQEYNLLIFFMKHPNEVFSSGHLLRLVWDPNTVAGHDTVRGHIKRLRRKLETPGRKIPLIQNLYGFGYRMNK